MAKSLAQFASDVRGYISKGKIKPARKAYDKAIKAGHKGPQLKELELELALAEEGGLAAAQALQAVAVSAEQRVPAAIKHVESHLRKAKDDHALRDALWEICLEHENYEAAIRHLRTLIQANGVDGNARAKALLGRKDPTGAAGIFLLATFGAIKTDRIKLADKLLANNEGARKLSGICGVLHSSGVEDGEIHYVLAQAAKAQGDRDAFMLHAGKAFDEDPAGIWTNTMADQSSTDRLEFALAKGSLKYLLQACGAAEKKEIVGAAQKSKGEGGAGKALRGIALLLTNKVPNACRILEGLVQEESGAAAPLAKFLGGQRGRWKGAHEVFGAVVDAGLASDAALVADSIDGMLQVGEQDRGEAWGRVTPRLMKLAPDRDDLRRELGHYFMAHDAATEAAALLESEKHLAIARGWGESGRAAGLVLLRAAELAEEHEQIPDHAEWLLKAARNDSAVLSELGSKLSGAVTSVETALPSASALLDQGQKQQAAEVLSRLPLDAESGGVVNDLLKERGLIDSRAFQTVSFRCALALGDRNRAKRLFPQVDENVQSLAVEAARHPASGQLLAEILIAQGKGEIGVQILDRRRGAEDDPRTLLPLADALVKSSPNLSMGRLVRSKLLRALKRDVDSVRDLRAIPVSTPEVGEAFKILGEIGEAGAEAAGSAILGRADINIGRKQFADAVKELDRCPADAAQRLSRYETVCRAKQEMDAAQRGRATTLLELKRVPEAAEAHFKRFHCPDSDPASVATDLEVVAKAALDANDIQTGGSILEQLPNRVSDGADRAIGVIGDDQRAELLILRSRLLLQLERTEEAVSTLSNLVRTAKESRTQAAEALDAIIESGQARPEADFALADTYRQMKSTPAALGALTRLYGDDLTGKDRVVAAARSLVVDADDPDVRIFLGHVCLDMRDPKGATENAIHARRLRPAARRDCVKLLQRALDQDAFAPETHFSLAEAHLAGDEADDAVRHFRAAVEVEKARAHSAIGAMEEAAPRSKRPALLWLAVGTTYAEFQKDHSKAVDAFTHGLDTRPTTEMKVPLLLGRGDSYAALREDDKAFDDFDEASRHDLLERRYYEFLRARHRQRVQEAAEAAASKASKSFAHAAEAVGRYIKLGKFDDAVNCAQQALARATDEVGPLYLVGVALHAAGRYDAAAQMLERVRSSAGADLAVGRAARMLLAESHADSGDRGAARACLTEVEAVDSLYPGLKTRRAALAPPADDPHAPPPLFVRPEFPRPTE